MAGGERSPAGRAVAALGRDGGARERQRVHRRAALQARQPEGEEFDAVEFYQNLYAKMDALEIDRAPGTTNSYRLSHINWGFYAPWTPSLDNAWDITAPMHFMKGR